MRGIITRICKIRSANFHYTLSHFFAYVILKKTIVKIFEHASSILHEPFISSLKNKQNRIWQRLCLYTRKLEVYRKFIIISCDGRIKGIGYRSLVSGRVTVPLECNELHTGNCKGLGYTNLLQKPARYVTGVITTFINNDSL